MERLINRRQQGDLGEASAIEWLTGKGATVLIPFGHSPHFDLVAEIGDRLYRIQVKTSTYRTGSSNGTDRFAVQLATSGGNQSWTGTVKRFDYARVEFLFVLVGDGRRWLIPSPAVEGSRAIHLGGRKYSEYEIEPGRAIEDVVYHELNVPLESDAAPGEYRSGQPGGAVNAMAIAFAGSNPASPIASREPVKPTRYERKLGQSGEAIINQKRRLTIPQRAFFEAGFQNGSKVRVRADGAGRIVCEQVALPGWAMPSAHASQNEDGPP